jgi:hypothetical protein
MIASLNTLMSSENIIGEMMFLDLSIVIKQEMNISATVCTYTFAAV